MKEEILLKTIKERRSIRQFQDKTEVQGPDSDDAVRGAERAGDDENTIPIRRGPKEGNAAQFVVQNGP